MHYGKKSKNHHNLSPVIGHSQFVAMAHDAHRRGPTPEEVAKMRAAYAATLRTYPKGSEEAEVSKREYLRKLELAGENGYHLNSRYKMQTLGG